MSCFDQKNSATPLSPVGEEYICRSFPAKPRTGKQLLSDFAFAGSKLQRTRCMVSRSGSEYIIPIACCFSLPTPCSPVIEPVVDAED